MSSIRMSAFAFIFLLFAANARADLDLQYSQTQNFWTILNAIQHGTGTLDSAASLLNQTFGNPEGLTAGIRYAPHAYNPETVTLREVRVDLVGYAYSTNPVDPRLFGWAGAGPEVTAGYQFFEVYGGRYWAKLADAASTDLIDRRLLESEEVSFFGFGVHQDFHFDQIDRLPVHVLVKTRTTDFLSSRADPVWYTHWAIDADGEFGALLQAPFSVKLLLLTGPEPVPGFKESSRIWDYLFKVDSFSDAMSMVGIGTTLEFETLKDVTVTFGFFGGYFGGQIGVEPLHNLIVNFQSYGVETTAAYQAQEMRFWGANLEYRF